MRCKQAADVRYLHASTVESMLARYVLPVISIAMSKSSKSRGWTRENCGVHTPEGSTNLVTLDSSVRPRCGSRRYDSRIGLFEDAPFQQKQVSYIVFGGSGGFAGDALEKSLGNAKAPTISRILTLEQSWYGKGNFAGVVEQDVDSKKSSRRDCSGGCAGAVERGEPCCGKRKRLTSVARLGVNKGRSSHVTLRLCTILITSL